MFLQPSADDSLSLNYIMIPAIILGIIAGIFFGLIPGLNLGFFFLLAYNRAYNTHPEFLFYFFLISAITGSIVNYITLLTPVANSNEPAYLNSMSDLIRQGLGIQAVYQAIFSYVSGLALTLIIAVYITVSGETYWLKTALNYIPLSALIAIFCYGILILKSPKPIWAVLIIVVVGFSGFLILDKFPVNSMFILSTAIFGCGLGSTVKSSSLPPQIEPDLNIANWNVIYFLVGIFSGWLIGLPTSALCSVFSEEEDDELVNIANVALAQGSASGISLLLILTNSGARDTLSTYLDYLNYSFTPSNSIFLFISILFLIAFVLKLIDPLINIYVSIINIVNPQGIKFFVLALNTASLIYFVGPAALLLILLGISIGNIIQQAQINKGLSLISISLIPIVSLF